MIEKIYYICMIIVGVNGFIFYPIYYRMQYNYYTKHRSELTRILYGGDPFGSKKLSWSDQFLIGAGISYCLAVAWRDRQNKRIPKQPLAGLDPDILKNKNYLKIESDHPFLKKMNILLIIGGSLLLVPGGIAFLLGKFAMQ